MKYCGVIHPDLTGVKCNKSPDHKGDHTGLDGLLAFHDWANTPPEVRLTSGNENSKEAAKTYVVSGAHKTRLDKVAAFFNDNVGVWIDSAQLSTPTVGGMEGTRRMRELRETHGWPIETRRAHGNTWQHRLTSKVES